MPDPGQRLDGRDLRAFRSGIVVPTIMDVPSGCVCTWVPTKRGWELKFAHRDCVHVNGKEKYRPFEENGRISQRKESIENDGNVPYGMREGYSRRGTVSDISPKSMQREA